MLESTMTVLVTFRPIIDSGMDLVSRLERQQEAFDNHDIELNSVPLSKRVTHTGLDVWYRNCYRIVEDTFGKDSEENKILKSGIAAIDAQHKVKVRTDFARMTAERLVAIIAILQQFETRLLSEEKHKANTPNELAKMFAPQVIGHLDAKVGTLRSIVNVKETKHIAGFRTRLHTDFVGDPGTAKSFLVNESTKIVSNAKYVTTQHASIKSALAIFDKDPEHRLTLMLGPVPQARNSICGI